MKHGDIGGLELLVARHYLRAVRTAYLITRNRDLAEDIVQAAFLRAYERIEQFDSSRPFAPWFLRIVINDARISARREDRLVSLNNDSQPEGLELPPFPNSNAALDELLIAAETREAIWIALGKLSIEQRSVIVLKYYLGLNETASSQELNCAPGTVKSRLHTARKRLRQLLPAWLDPLAKD